MFLIRSETMNKHISKTISIIAMCALLAGCSSVKAATSHKKHHEPKNALEQTQKTAAAEKKNTTNGSISYYFPKDNGHPDKHLISIINSAKSNLDIAIYSLTKPNIVQSIVNAKERGLNVRVITDSKESENSSESKELGLLKDASIPIKINTHPGLMHLKVTIADNSIVTTGSYNYTDAATYENDEVLVVLNDKTTAAQFDKEFVRMWNDTANFKQY